MLNQIYTICLKEFKVMFREKGLVAVLFFMPAVFVLILTAAGVGSQGGLVDANILIVNHDHGAIAQRTIDRLRKNKELTVTTEADGAPLQDEAAKRLLTKHGSSFALILLIPNDFSQKIQMTPSKTPPVELRFIEDPGQDATRSASVERLVKGDVLNEVTSIETADQSAFVLRHLAGMPGNDLSDKAKGLSAQFSQAMDGFDSKVPLNIEFVHATPQGTPISRPIKSIEQNVPAYTIFGIFFIVQVVATSLLRERENGTFLRLDAAPVSRVAILIGKLIPYYVINILQVLVLFSFGHFAFHLTLGRSPLGLVAMTLATAAAANALGLSIASVSKSQEQMGPMSALILVVSAACGGVFIPTFQMPRLMQTLSFLTPHAWAIQGFQDIIVRDYGLREVYTPVLVLFGYALVNYAFALKKFRFE
jgi:ABC-2 type transport system permease protein